MIDLKALLAKAAALPAAPKTPQHGASTPSAPPKQLEVPAEAQEAPPSFIHVPREALISGELPGKVPEEETLPSKAVPALDIYNSSVGSFEVFKPITDEGSDPGPVPDEVKWDLKPVTFKIPPSPESPNEEIVAAINRPNPTADPVGLDDNCAHLCESCNEWWSHGPRNKCRHPDVIKQGLCATCLNGSGKEANPDPLAELIEDERGRKTLAPAYQVKIRNDERDVCKNMDIEQLSRHIEHTYKRELEMRARGAESRKMRAELIDYEAQEIPEAEREAFKQALLLGKKTKEKKPPKQTKAAAKEAQLRELTEQLKSDNCQNAALVAQWMLQTGKSRKQVEAMLND